MSEDRDRDDWTLSELLDAEREATQDELHTSFPGRIESYDAAAQVADVRPMVRRSLVREDGTIVHEDLPTLRAVPVVWPRATSGGWFMHFPLGAGDEVRVDVCERDIARWLQTGELSTAPDGRLHHLANATCTPGLSPRGRRLGGMPPDALRIGLDGGSVIDVRTDGEIHVGGDRALCEHVDLDQHLSAIAAGLNALAARIAPLDSGSPLEVNYGTAAKAIQDLAAPIATTITKGT